MNIIDIINKVAASLDNSAAQKNLIINKTYKETEILIKGARQELHDAIYNILHNAIKYSWEKKGSPGWITIRIINDKTHVYISVENYGVPIKKIEIDEKLIFKFNYRGANSQDRDRYGWGIGLWQSKKLITGHGGNIKVTSKPADKISTDFMDNPYITELIVKLPKTR